MRKYAAELVALSPNVLLGPGTTPVRPLLEATRTALGVCTECLMWPSR